MTRQQPTPLAILALLMFFVSCRKDPPPPEAILHGRWVKGSAVGDTLRFYEYQGKHYWESNQSTTGYEQDFREYRVVDGQLNLLETWQMLSWAQPVESFAWKVRGQSFEIHEYDVYYGYLRNLIDTTYVFTKIP